MTTIWKPRGPQKPFRVPTEGIKVFDLVRFLRDAQKHLEVKGDSDQACTFEILADYFEEDYKTGEKLNFKPGAIGL